MSHSDGDWLTLLYSKMLNLFLCFACLAQMLQVNIPTSGVTSTCMPGKPGGPGSPLLPSLPCGEIIKSLQSCKCNFPQNIFGIFKPLTFTPASPFSPCRKKTCNTLINPVKLYERLCWLWWILRTFSPTFPICPFSPCKNTFSVKTFQIYDFF